jgi:hypothetical protein
MSYCQILHSGANNAVARPLVSAAWAVAALALLLLWQFLTVHYNRAGNWTALFLIGQTYTPPPELSAGAFRFPGGGFDGEMYRTVAHDPFLQRGYVHYVDVPTDRYRRILIPGMAYLLAVGYQPWIDGSYVVVIALFVFAGAYWVSRWAVLAGAHPAWALAFLLVPATLISADRMTVDVALAAFTVAVAVYWKTGPAWKLFSVLLLACLVRDTGLLLVAGVCLFELLRRRFARAVPWASAALPMFAWYFFISRIFPEKTHYGAPAWFASRLGPGLFYRMLQPPRYPLPPLAEAIARSADALALAGILLAAILAILLVVRARSPVARNRRDPLAFSGLLFAALVFLLTGRQYWTDVNGYARVLSPLLILVALPSIASLKGAVRNTFPWWLGFVPAFLVDLRLGLQFTSAIGGVVRGLLHV